MRSHIDQIIGRSQGLEKILDHGQTRSLAWLGRRLIEGGAILADEVGTGKTRIACAIARAVLRAGGRVAIVCPRQLMGQWRTNWCVLDGVDHGSVALNRLETVRHYAASFGDRSDESPTSFPPTTGSHRSDAWLLSKTLFPQNRKNALSWADPLPDLVEAALKQNGRDRDDRCKPWNTWKHFEDVRANSFKGVQRDIAREIAHALKQQHGSTAAALKELNRLSKLEWHAECVELLGLWLGSFDLVIVDEAHKGKAYAETFGSTSNDGNEADDQGNENDENEGQIAVQGSQLHRLLEDLLVQPPHGRRLCMTATPLELRDEDWRALLARTKVDPNQAKACMTAFAEFKDAMHAARRNPTPDRLERLKQHSERFQSEFARVMTRRRRCEEPLFIDFGARAPRASTSRPHRRIEAAHVALEDAGPWREALFAGECLSLAMRGLPAQRADRRRRADSAQHVAKTLYTKLAAGHLSADLDTDTFSRWLDDLAAELPDDHAMLAKVGRARYWQQRMRSALPRGRKEALRNHPRVTAAADLIVRDVEAGHKVLVFGVFVEPLKALRDVLRDRLGDGAAALLLGDVPATKRVEYKNSFNKAGTAPHVLIAQSTVGREGLDLHLACRRVVQFHPEWNPGVLEQQIGRVDRKGGLWEREVRAWMGGACTDEPPRIEVRRLVIAGTYDHHQWDRVGRRQQLFDATLFGDLLPVEAWERLDEAARQRLKNAAPSFTPPALETRR